MIVLGRTAGNATFFRLPKWMMADSPFPWLAPLLAMLLIFAVFPFFYNIYLSLHEFVPRDRALVFVGFDNWAKLLSDDRMWNATAVTFFYTAVCLVIQTTLGFAIALPSHCCSIRTDADLAFCAVSSP